MSKYGNKILYQRGRDVIQYAARRTPNVFIVSSLRFSAVGSQISSSVKTSQKMQLHTYIPVHTGKAKVICD